MRVDIRLLSRPAVFLGIALALGLAANLLWSVGTDIRETALNPACRLLHAKVEMALDCDTQEQFGFCLALIAPLLAIAALVAFFYGISGVLKGARHLFPRAHVTYHRNRNRWLDSGGGRNEFDFTGTPPDDADFRRD